MYSCSVAIMYWIVAVILFFSIGAKANLPPYLTQCRNGDGACQLQNAKNAVIYLGKSGDSKWKLTGLDPIRVERVELTLPNLQILLTNLEFHGYDKIDIISVEIENNKLHVKTKLIRSELLCDYDIKGHILILPIKGDGKLNITAIDLDLGYMATLGKKEINGKQHYFIESHEAFFRPAKEAYFHLTNLFDGDEKLGAEMNKFVNDNRKAVYQEFESTLIDSVASMFKMFISKYFNKIPINELLIEE